MILYPTGLRRQPDNRMKNRAIRERLKRCFCMFDPGKSGMGQHSKCPDHLATKKIAARKAKNSIARGTRVNAGGVMLTFWRSWARRVRRKSHSKILKTINMIAINPSKRITLNNSSLIIFRRLVGLTRLTRFSYL